MRALALSAAAAHALLLALFFLGFVDVVVLATSAVIFTVVLGLVILIRNGPESFVWTATAAGLTALAGWGSWLVLLALDPGSTDPSINVIGVLLTPIAVLAFLVAAFLPATRR